jgi:putative salt-induced outer membrane protein YdiY
MPRPLAVALTFAVLVVAAHPVFAQATQAPPKLWTIVASAGLALTSGNSDTSTVNLAYDITYDPKRRNILKSDGLMLRGKTEGTVTANRLGLNVRDEYRINPRVFVFGQNQFLKDEFKDIDYLLAPTAGVGYKIFDTDATKLGLDISLGGVWEKNPGVDVNASGAIALGQKLTRTLTSTTTLTQAFSGLWKARALDDALYTLGVSLSASMSTRTQLKVEVLDTFKTRPPLATVQKNDVAVLMAIVYKM